MAQKPIDPHLLWDVMFWVLYQYSKLTPDKRRERPLRGYRHDDGKLVAKAVRTIRMARHYQLKAWKDGKRSEPDFKTVKKLVIESLGLQYGWETQTRNFISSCAATYITWDYAGQSDVSQRKLSFIRQLAGAFLDPNNERGIRHGQTKSLFEHF